MKNVFVPPAFLGTLDPRLVRPVNSAVKKLSEDPTRSGLHVEPIEQCRDDRVRTARVNRQYRLVLFDVGEQYVLHGVYNHEEAYDVAATAYLRVNPVSGTVEIRESGTPGEGSSPVIDQSEIDSRARALAAEIIARRDAEAAARTVADLPTDEGPTDDVPAEPTAPTGPAITGVTVEQLTDQLGIDRDLADAALVATEDELIELATTAPGVQGDMLLDLATGRDVGSVRVQYVRTTKGGTDADTPSSSEDVAGSLSGPVPPTGFHLIEDDDDLAAVLESADFGRWRIFLHPDQRNYVEMRTRGPFRLSGGAGTGKTVVLVHRAVRLARRSSPAPRIVATTFTVNLANSMAMQVNALDPKSPRANHLGESGILVKGVDQLVYEVMSKGGRIGEAMDSVLGWSMKGDPRRRSAAKAGWKDAIGTAGDDLDEHLRTEAFFESEYSEVILPQRIVTEQEYMRAPRAGRGTKLGRLQRRAVWAVVARYREDGMRAGETDYDETAAVAAVVLDTAAEGTGHRPADHVLVDEGQDLSPSRWQFLRALVAEGEDDLFIADDAHQRIYGNRIVLKRYGIDIVGRSRRLRLNYRTTAENLRFALTVLRDGRYSTTESEGADAVEEAGSYRSARTGPEPLLRAAATVLEEYDVVADLVRTWSGEMQEEGIDLSGLGILARSAMDRDRLARALAERGVGVEVVDRGGLPSGVPVVMNLHRSKGTEFSRVILFGMSAGSVPAHMRGAGYDEDAARDAELRERSLLYVGASRARDHLAVTWSERPSEYIAPSVAEAGGPTPASD